jgi:hypothetical protein
VVAAGETLHAGTVLSFNPIVDRLSPADETLITSMKRLCTNCPKRSRCVSLGWLSPSGLWFPDQVVIRPEPGCQLHDMGGSEVIRQLGVAIDRPDESRPPVKAAE